MLVLFFLLLSSVEVIRLTSGCSILFRLKFLGHGLEGTQTNPAPSLSLQDRQDRQYLRPHCAPNRIQPLSWLLRETVLGHALFIVLGLPLAGASLPRDCTPRFVGLL